MNGDCKHIVRSLEVNSYPVLSPEQQRAGFTAVTGSQPIGWVCAGCLLDRIAALEKAVAERSAATSEADPIRDMAVRALAAVALGGKP